MIEKEPHIDIFRDNLNNAHTVKVINIIVAINGEGKLVHNHMEHPHPVTRPMLMKILRNLLEQVEKDYENIKSMSNLENAERLLNIMSGPAHNSKPNIGSEPTLKRKTSQF